MIAGNVVVRGCCCYNRRGCVLTGREDRGRVRLARGGVRLARGGVRLASGGVRLARGRIGLAGLLGRPGGCQLLPAASRRIGVGIVGSRLAKQPGRWNTHGGRSEHSSWWRNAERDGGNGCRHTAGGGYIGGRGVMQGGGMERRGVTWRYERHRRRPHGEAGRWRRQHQCAGCWDRGWRRAQ